VSGLRHADCAAAVMQRNICEGRVLGKLRLSCGLKEICRGWVARSHAPVNVGTGTLSRRHFNVR
jgi:hypothetical protein